MGILRKIFAGGLGWVLGGPIGLVVGVAVASLIDGDFTAPEPRKRVSNHTSQSDFMMAMLVLLAAVMKADGRLLRTELDVIKSYLRQIFDEETALEALQILKGLLKQDIDVESVAVQVGANLNASAKREMLHMLFSVGYADGSLSRSEEALLLKIASLMGISEADARSIQAMFGKDTNPNWAYDVLEIQSTASDDEVKKAYRKMAMKYHPDRVNTLGEEIKKSATEKFRRVQEAYETIKEQRNMN
ncbi:MAG TPA: TerB family tellurite resistance protein [Paludibacteraceae bacterium]|nr:TerB family tellurite resistance protein [Paludibacteraceae bacterium]HQB68865.1 TerB family tellurite resistance protein [Paludibacteraceae bacterium]HRS67131.1 TerB family tellurite resistance protein [Paludibacteraceae bacterium]